MCHLCAIAIEPDRDGIRTFPVLILLVIPCLGTGNLCGFWGVAVGDDKSCGSVTSDHGIITVHLYLFDGIDDFLPVLVLVQTAKGSRPVVTAAECQGFLGFLPICQQLHGNAFRPDTILIVLVLPRLCHGDTGLLRRVGVGDIEVRIGRRVTVHGILGNGIVDRLSVFVLGKISKTPLPAFFGSYFLVCHLCAIAIEPDRDGIRTFPVLILLVIPCLGTGNLCGFWGVAVGDDKSCGSVTSDHGIITVHLYLFDGIDDFLPVLVLVQTAKGSRPVVTAAEYQGFLGLLTICQKFYGNAFRTDTILIILVLPRLRDSYTSLLRRVGVGNIEVRIGRRVTVHGILGNGIVDRLSVFVLGKISKTPLPAFFGSYFLVCHLCAIAIEPDRDGIRTFPVLILLVIPCLGTGNLCGFWGVAVGDDKSCGSVTSDHGIITVHLYLFDGIDDFLPVLVLVQTAKGSRPVVTAAECQGFLGFLPICQQLHGNAFRPDTILIVIIRPRLCHGNTGLLR